MAKFKAGDMIVGRIEMSDGTKQWSTLMVNRVFTDEREYSFTKGQEMYSLDNGSGFSDARSTAVNIDRDYEIAN